MAIWACATPASKEYPVKNTAKEPFWKTTPLGEMNQRQWESLCDGCGKCCLVLLVDDDDDSIWETDVACPLFDAGCRRCTDYKNRSTRMPDCVTLTSENIGKLPWMPDTCAYRLLHEGKELPDWHPLVSGEKDSVVKAGVAVAPTLPSEDEFSDDDLTDRIVCKRC